MKEIVKSYEDLRVWQYAMDLVPDVYGLIACLPLEERFSLAQQMRRAAVSIPANIAEGFGRHHTKELIRHLLIARGSLCELETLLLVVSRLGYAARDQVAEMRRTLSGVGKLLSALINSLMPARGMRSQSRPYQPPTTSHQPRVTK